MNQSALVDRLLDVVEFEIAPKTAAGVARGNKLFGAAILRKTDWSTVISITWGGYDNFYYLFSHEDSRDSFNIPHDLRILKAVFGLEPGGYAPENHYWKSYNIPRLIDGFEEPNRARLCQRVETLIEVYAGLSEIYQGNKHLAGGDIPLD
jgi:tRNA(Arg) A34 adenosine deaminase TadA